MTILSGFFLSGHYVLLAISVNVTSIAHAVCFMSSTPITAVVIQMFTKKAECTTSSRNLDQNDLSDSSNDFC